MGRKHRFRANILVFFVSFSHFGFLKLKNKEEVESLCSQW